MSPPAPAGALAAAASATGLALAYRLGFGSRSQCFGPFPYAGEDDGRRTVALTFDDGPNEPWTSLLLDVLGDRGVPATFFQVGRCAERYPDVTRRVVAEGHVLGNHSLSHSFGRYLSEPRQRAEIEGGRRVLAEITGRSPALYRPPWLCHWPWVLAGVAASGSSVVSGTFGSPLEVLQPPAARMTADALRRTRPGAVLILHDGREARGGPRARTVAAVGPLIDALRGRGYRFATVDRLLGVEPYR